jgi:hypothetical protein
MGSGACHGEHINGGPNVKRVGRFILGLIVMLALAVSVAAGVLWVMRFFMPTDAIHVIAASDTLCTDDESVGDLAGS